MTESREVDRLGAFTDGVLAIAITLLVLDLRVPGDVAAMSDADLGQALLAIWPKYMGYLISFLVIGNYWVIHNAKFRRLTSVTPAFVWLNIWFLLVVGLLPFTTSVLSENGGTIATSVYAANVALASALLAWMGLYAEAHDMVDVTIVESRWRHAARSLITTVVFLLSIVIAQFNPDWARYFWFVLVPASILVRPTRKT